jgi:hypothetical protein
MHRSLSKPLLCALVVSAFAFACSSTSTGGGGDSGTSSGSGGDSGGPSETFTDVYTTVLQPHCTSHHVAGGADSFLDLSTQAAAYTSLVGVTASGPACGTSGNVRVKAGSPSASLLFQKVSQASPPCGAQMPLNGTPLSQADQTKIQSWIIQGAAND